jgi:hypothetical protein
MQNLTFNKTGNTIEMNFYGGFYRMSCSYEHKINIEKKEDSIL